MKNNINFVYAILVFGALACFATFTNEKEAPCEPFFTSQKGNLITGTYDGNVIFDVMCDVDKNIRSFYNTSDILQSSPLTQVRTIAFNDREEHVLRVNLYLSQEAGVMRSKRAEDGEAILGRVGEPLIRGVAGVYDIRRDFLLEWSGGDWEWCDDKMARDENGNLKATFNITITNYYFNIIFRPNYYRSVLSYKNYKPWLRRPNLKSVNGWCSWKAYGDRIKMENIEQTAAFIKDKFSPYGMDVMQIDNGFQRKSPSIEGNVSLAESWMRPSASFPEGPASIAKKISSYGLRPGIWISPGIDKYAPNDSPRELRCVLPNGRKANSYWINTILDMSDYTITNCFVLTFQAFKDAGFEYVKIDGLRHVFYEGLLLAYGYNEAVRRLRNFCLATRLALGDDFYILGCWGIMPEISDSFDACRVASDCGDTWIDHHRQLYYFAEMFPLNRVLFVNDPDHMVMRVSEEWGRAKVSTVSLGGGTYMFSDKPEDLDKERIYILQRGLPSLETYPAESGQMHLDHITNYVSEKDVSSEEEAMRLVGGNIEPGVDSPFSTLWAVHFAKDWGCWCVVTRNALWSLGESNVELEKLGLDRKKTYLAYDFWEKKFFGEVKEGLPMKALKYGSCQVVSLREKRDEPQFVASTRHVSMDAVSVKNIEWKDKELTLTLDCVENTSETYSFFVPEGYKFEKAECEGGEAKASEVGSNGLLEIEVSAKKKDVDLRLKFN